jgi:prephenate dehydratase
MIRIHTFLPQAECEYSGKTGEAVEVSTDDGSIRHAVICIAELAKLLRFRHRQQDKQSGPDRAAS